MTGYIYAVRCGERVKIGWSETPLVRFSKIQSDSPARCDLLGICQGTQADEANLHGRFRAYRVHGEWFRLDGPVAEWICRMEIVRPTLAAATIRSVDSLETVMRKEEAHSMTLDEFKSTHALTDGDLAERLGIDRSLVAKLRSGKARPSLDVAARIESVTGIPARTWARTSEAA